MCIQARGIFNRRSVKVFNLFNSNPAKKWRHSDGHHCILRVISSTCLKFSEYILRGPRNLFLRPGSSGRSRRFRGKHLKQLPGLLNFTRRWSWFDKSCGSWKVPGDDFWQAGVGHRGPEGPFPHGKTQQKHSDNWKKLFESYKRLGKKPNSSDTGALRPDKGDETFGMGIREWFLAFFWWNHQSADPWWP